jgi:hypothetical protein
MLPGNKKTPPPGSASPPFICTAEATGDRIGRFALFEPATDYPEPGILSAEMQYPRTRTLSSGYKIATTITFRFSRLFPSQRPGQRGY